MATISLTSTQKTIGVEIAGSSHFHCNQTKKLSNQVNEIFQSIFTHDATFRSMKQAAARLNMEWAGRTNFVVYLPFSVTAIPLVIPQNATAEETNIQKAFAQCFAKIKANHANIHTNEVFMNGHITIGSSDSYQYISNVIDDIDHAMWQVTKMVEIAVIQKKGWSRYEL